MARITDVCTDCEERLIKCNQCPYKPRIKKKHQKKSKVREDSSGT